jgi:hypothetical protein
MRWDHVSDISGMCSGMSGVYRECIGNDMYSEICRDRGREL